MSFPWLYGQAPSPKPLTTREQMLKRLSEGVPKELVTRAAGLTVKDLEGDADADKAIAEGEILLFERARDSGVTGIVRSAMRHEAGTWAAKVEPNLGQSLEDLLRD